MKTERKRHYIDPDLQGGLILALVLLQAALVAGVLIWLQADLEALLEARLYRVHQTGGEPMSELLLARSAPALAVMLVADLALLALAEFFWSRRLRRLAAGLNDLAARSAELDFRADPHPAHLHAALDKARIWRRWEADRLARFRAMTRELAQAPAERRPLVLERMGRLLGRREPDRD